MNWIHHQGRRLVTHTSSLKFQIEELAASMRFKNPSRTAFNSKIKVFIDFVVSNPEYCQLVMFLIKLCRLISTIVSSSWAIPRVDRDEFAVSIVKIYGRNRSLLPLVHDSLEKNFQVNGFCETVWFVTAKRAGKSSARGALNHQQNYG